MGPPKFVNQKYRAAAAAAAALYRSIYSKCSSLPSSLRRFMTTTLDITYHLDDLLTRSCPIKRIRHACAFSHNHRSKEPARRQSSTRSLALRCLRVPRSIRTKSPSSLQATCLAILKRTNKVQKQQKKTSVVNQHRDKRKRMKGLISTVVGLAGWLSVGPQATPPLATSTDPRCDSSPEKHTRVKIVGE